MYVFNFVLVLTIAGGFRSHSAGASETDYEKLDELRNKLKDLQNVVEDYKTVLEDAQQDQGDSVEQILTSDEKEENVQSSEDLDDKLLHELKQKVQYLQEILDEKAKTKDAKRLPQLPPRYTVTRQKNQRGTVTKDEDQRATVTRGEDQRATVTKNEDQRATVTRNEDQRATVTREGHILSREDVELLQKLQSKILHLRTVLEKENNGGVTEEISNIVQPDEEKATLKNLPHSVRNLNPSDIELLKTVQMKIHDYQKSQYRGSKLKNSRNDKHSGQAFADTQTVKEGTFGKFEDPSELRDSGYEEKWEDTPLPDSQLGIHTQKKPAENVINEVQRRLLSDIRYARENGVDIKQLLRSLQRKQVRSASNEESELESLTQQEAE